jgi:hypothetical protein
MPTARRKTASKQQRRRPAAARAGDASLKRLNSSLDTAHDALTELSKNVGRGGRDAVKDVHQRIGELRKDARKLNKSLRSELDQLQKSIAGARSGAKRTGARKAATKSKAASARKPASSRRTTARGRSSAKRSTKSARSRKTTASRKS